MNMKISFLLWTVRTLSHKVPFISTQEFTYPILQAKHALLEEIREINQQLIDTVVVISDEDTIPTAAATEGGGGTIIKCSFSAVAISPNFKSQQVQLR